MKKEIDRIVAGLAPHPGPGITPGARELFEEISSTPPAPATETAARFRWLQWRISLPVVATLAAAALIFSWLLPASVLGPTPASAALDIRTEGGYYVITVKDLFAKPERYESQLRSRGLDFTFSLEPVAPSFEGQVTTLNEDIIPISRPGACGRSRSCPIGVKVPVGYQGKADVRLGRKALPGEAYMSFSAIDSPGEPLYCIPYVGKSVDEVRALLNIRGVQNLIFFDGKGSPPSVPGSWYVHEGFMSRPDAAKLLVGPTRKRPNVPGPVLRGCARRH